MEDIIIEDSLRGNSFTLLSTWGLFSPKKIDEGSLKDVLAIKGVETTAASNILKGYVPPYDATVVKKLREQGVVFLGKTNCDAFAHGSSTENSDFGPTKNPWDLTRVPGGSSGGSAASVAAEQALFSLGTDTGGSIRFPASFCGVVGLKPTYARVSRYGLFAMGSSLDCIGPMTRSVQDAAIVLESFAGLDPKDATSSNHSVDSYANDLKTADIRDKVIGLPKEYINHKNLHPEVKKLIEEAVKSFISMGAKVEEVSLPHTDYAVPVYYILCSSEVSANLARYDGIRYGHSVTRDKHSDPKSLLEVYEQSRSEGFGDEAKRRIMIGTHRLSSGYYDAYYLKASKVRALIKQDFVEAFEKVDFMVTPTAPHPAFKLGEKSKNPLDMYLEDILVSPASLAGLPALSVPCGFVDDMPVGLQLIGNYFDETTILQAAHLYEQEHEWSSRRPQMISA